MSLPDRIAVLVTTRSKTVLVTLLLLTVLVGSGMTMLDDDSSLGQFESESPETQAAEYIEDNFAVEETENQTTVQLISRGENVLSQESVLESLRFQQEIHATPEVANTLVDDEPITGVENVLAITHIQQERADELEANTAELESALDETRELERSYAELNASYEAGEISDAEYDQEAEAIETEFQQLQADATAPLDDEQAGIFLDAFEQVRTIEAELIELEQQLNAGEIDQETYQAQQEPLIADLEAAYEQGTAGVYADEYEALEDGETPSLDEQLEAIDSLGGDEYETLVEETLTVENEDVLAMLPSGYEPGTATADTRMTILTQTTEESEVDDMGGVFGPVVDAQLELQELAHEQDDEYMVFGFGIMSDEIDQSMADSLAIVGPLALLFVVAALMVAYRDVLDILLGVVGILAVLVWTFGFMGWVGIDFNQMFVAVPVLLIGLSIDYAIHVFMRHREQRESADDDVESPAETDDTTRNDVDASMRIALAGVGVALVWVTATAAIGFLANMVSPIQPIREFGLVSAFGIASALVVFGGIVPAAKVELDTALESAGFDRHKRAFGTSGGRFSRVLETGAIAARKAPFVVLLVVVLISAGGVYGAANVDTTFDEEDFLADDPPAWTEHLPAAISPGEYQMTENLAFVNEHYTRQDARAEFLVEGDVTDDETLRAMSEAEASLNDRTDTVVYELPSGQADVSSPLQLMQTLADEESQPYNESFAATFDAADTNDDGIPNQDLEAVYDELLSVQPGAAELLYRTDDGEYEALRMVVAVQGDAELTEITAELRTVADEYEASGDGAWSVTATGDPIVFYVIEQDLFETVLESLLITLVVVFAFLSIAYWLTGNSASLGAVTLLPVALATSWILGTMYLIGMPFNVLTGMITSLTIGLGVAYCIHISSRYTLELERQGNVWDAMETTVRGTGGALLGSAATTVGGFGTLALAILPMLQQFGIITGLTIIYAFLASVIVLPTLLVLWTRYAGPTDVSFARTDVTAGETDAGTSEPEHARGDDD